MVMAEPSKQRVPNLIDTVQGAIGSFDDLADAIANPDPSKPLRNAIGRSGRLFCNFIGATPDAAKAALGPGINAGALVCRPYWDKNDFTAPVPAAPFTGGQCAANYQVRAGGTADVKSCTTGQITAQRTRAMADIGAVRAGPVTGVRLIPGTASNCGVQNYDLEITGPNIGTVVSVGFWSPNSGASSEMVNPQLQVEVVLISGLNNCGDPELEPIPGPSPPPTPPTFPTGQEPGVDPDGQPFFFVPPIDSPFPDEDPIEVPPISPAPTGGGGGSNPGEPEGGTPGATGEGGEEEGEAPPDKELYALKIDITTIPPYAIQYAAGVYRGVCYVYMGDENGLDHDPAGAMLRSGQLVLAETEGLTRWRVSANVGYNLSVTPYYRTPRNES